MPSSAGPSWPTRSRPRLSSRSRISSGRPSEGTRIESRKRSVAPERQITLGAVGEHLHRFIGPRQPRREPRQPARVAAFGREQGQQRAQPRPGEGRVAVGRIVGEGDLRLVERRDQPRFRHVEQRTRKHECRRARSHAPSPTAPQCRCRGAAASAASRPDRPACARSAHAWRVRRAQPAPADDSAHRAPRPARRGSACRRSSARCDAR